MNEFGSPPKFIRVAQSILFRFGDYEIGFASGQGLLLWLIMRIPTSLFSAQKQYWVWGGSGSVKWYGAEVDG